MTWLMRIDNKQLAYLVARFAVGVSILMHGAVRLPRLNEFATDMSNDFAGTIIAGFPSLMGGYAVPFVEVLAGILILMGATYIRQGLALGIVLMGFLMFGSALIEEWQNVMAQMVHVVVFYLLLINPYTPDPTKEVEAKDADVREPVAVG